MPESSSAAPAKPTPLPWRPVLPVILTLFANSVIMTLPFPFLPFMIRVSFRNSCAADGEQDGGLLLCWRLPLA